MRLSDGLAGPLGVSPAGDGVNVAVHSAHATAIEFCLFDAAGAGELARFVLPGRTGSVWHGHVAGVGVGARYGLRAHGPFDPPAGLRFNPAKLLMDPHALAIDRPFRLRPSMLPGPHDTITDEDSAPDMPKAVVTAFEDHAAPGHLVPWSRTVVYELHVRGFTMRHPSVPAHQRGTWAALGHPDVVAHLVGLGVTSVEVMPPAAWIEERHLAALGLTNHWGYNAVAFCAPDPRLAPGGWAEIRAAVAALAAAGIETIVDMVLNHTGEGDSLGPTVSLRGLDNPGYYALRPEDMAHDIDDTGCGNTLALNRPHVLRLAMDALRAWACMGGVHGFRFDLAATMGRLADGFDPAAPLLQAIGQDPVLSRLKLIAEPWDVGPGGYRLGGFPAAWGEWNDRFRDDVRRAWRGDANMRGALATRLAGSADAFHGRAPSRSVNYVVAHDGFTLADLVSYAQKHNAANGEANRDGTDASYSWNNGVEGPSDDPVVLAARLADQKALLALLLLARGTPMLSMGSEMGHSQGGNNNAYAQDNATSWIDWSRIEPELVAWTRLLTGLRAVWPVLQDDRFLDGGALPDVTWHGADGAVLHDAAWNDGAELVLAMRLAGGGGRQGAALLVNPGRAPAQVALPGRWTVLADSAGGSGVEAGGIRLAARSVLLLGELAGPASADPGLLRRLAAAAGIAPEWWEVGGIRHVVGEDTGRALLAAMGLPADSDGAIRDSLARLGETRDRRVLPEALTVAEGSGGILAMRLPAGLNPRSTWLEIALEDGGTQRLRLPAGAAVLAGRPGLDGRQVTEWRVALPPLPAGRHVLRREDAPGVACALTVAPATCHLPAWLRDFGISAQLYSVPREGDQGVGDFTTLARLSARAAQAGAGLVAVNPLHALFGADRMRASPYYPSDRRFLDPVYLDLHDLPSDVPAPAARALLAELGPDCARLSGLGEIAWAEVWALKRAVLERFFAAFEAWAAVSPQAPSCVGFAAFVARGGAALRDFAAFEAIAEARAPDWRGWPASLRGLAASGVAAFAGGARARFHMFLQYLADDALSRAAASGRAAGLRHGVMRDLAVGAAPDGAEAWAAGGLLAHGAATGSPPDPFSAEGQVWGLPPPNPLAMAADGFRQFGALLAANMRHAGALRIDHAMGLARLFWVPDGARGSEGAYVAYPFADLLGQVTLESRRAGCMVVGEDLGTVPEGFRARMAAADMLGFRVLLLEREGTAFRAPASYPARALACVSTHDLPPLAGWWQGTDIAERAALGQVDAGGEAAAMAARDGERTALNQSLGRVPDGPEPTLPTEVAAAAHGFVAASPAEIVLAQAEELVGETVAVNLPGTDRERPNWRRRLAVEVEAVTEGAAARAILGTLRRERG